MSRDVAVPGRAERRAEVSGATIRTQHATDATSVARAVRVGFFSRECKTLAAQETIVARDQTRLHFVKM